MGLLVTSTNENSIGVVRIWTQYKKFLREI